MQIGLRCLHRKPQASVRPGQSGQSKSVKSDVAGKTVSDHDNGTLAKLYEARRADDYRVHLPRGDAVQVFRMRVNHVLLLASMSKRGWSQSASCRLCENRVEDVDHVLFDCPALEDCRSPGWGCQDRSQVLWAERSVLVEAAKLVRVFLRRTNE